MKSDKHQPWGRLVLIATLSLVVGCAPAPTSQQSTATATNGAGGGSALPSELNFIMKNHVNKPFSKLAFFVFHSGGDYNFTEIDKVTAEFHVGIRKARAYPDPPVESAEGRQVFATFLESLDRDCMQLANAIKRKDAPRMEQMVGKLSRTCNNCHHFFRLDIADTPEQ